MDRRAERRGVRYTLSVRVVSSRCSIVAVPTTWPRRCSLRLGRAATAALRVLRPSALVARTLRTGEPEAALLRRRLALGVRPRAGAGAVLGSGWEGLRRSIGGVSICTQAGVVHAVCSTRLIAIQLYQATQ